MLARMAIGHAQAHQHTTLMESVVAWTATAKVEGLLNLDHSIVRPQTGAMDSQEDLAMPFRSPERMRMAILGHNLLVEVVRLPIALSLATISP